MKKCKSTTASGKRCENIAAQGGYCRSHDPNFLKRPSDGKEFEDSVLKVLRLLGYTVERNVTLAGCQIDLRAEYRTGVIRLRLMVECKDESAPVGVEAVAKFTGILAAVRGQAIDKGLLVSKNGFTRAAKELAETAGVEVVTFVELSNRLIDFDSYVERVIADFEDSSVASHYIDLSYALTEDYFSDPGLVQRPLDDAVERILVRGSKSKLALLGNFGTGKTTWCRKFARDLAKQYRVNENSRLPILVPLSDYETKLDIQQLITNTLQFRYGVRIDITVCQELQRQGRFILIFDGFDEMAARVDAEVVRENLREINKVARIQENLFVLTCRTHFFRDRVQAEVLGDFESLFIPEWGESELNEYLQKRFGTEWESQLRKIRGSHNLPELAETPLFLEMITETLPKLGDKVRRTELYQTYTNTWIQGQSQRRGARLNNEERKQFVSELAVKLYRDGKVSCHYSEFSLILRNRFGVTDASAIDYMQSDVRSCTFVTRNASGDYEFRHKSFMEFFVAAAIKEQVAIESTELVGLRQLPVEVRGFLVEMLASDPPRELLDKWFRVTNDSVLSGNAFALIAALGLQMTSPEGGKLTSPEKERAEILLFLQGDKDAFVSVIARFRPKLERLLKSRCSDAAVVTDVASDTFFKALEYRDRVVSPDGFWSFIVRLAHNLLRDKTQRSSLGGGFSSGYLEIAEMSEEHFQTAKTPFDHLAEKEEIEQTNKALIRALETFSDSDRTIVERLFQGGVSTHDLANEMGISVNALRQRKSRLIKQLQKLLLEFRSEN